MGSRSRNVRWIEYASMLDAKLWWCRFEACHLRDLAFTFQTMHLWPLWFCFSARSKGGTTSLACIVRFPREFAAVRCRVDHVHGQRTTRRSRPPTTHGSDLCSPCIGMAQTYGELFYHVLDSCCSSRWRATHLRYGVIKNTMKAQQKPFFRVSKPKRSLNKYVGKYSLVNCKSSKEAPRKTFRTFSS